MKPLGYAVILLLCYFFPAQAQQVYRQCVAPPSKFGNVWYIDPVKGATQLAGGVGSATHPWNSLQAVFQTTPGYNYRRISIGPKGGPATCLRLARTPGQSSPVTKSCS